MDPERDLGRAGTRHAVGRAPGSCRRAGHWWRRASERRAGWRHPVLRSIPVMTALTNLVDATAGAQSVLSAVALVRSHPAAPVLWGSPGAPASCSTSPPRPPPGRPAPRCAGGSTASHASSPATRSPSHRSPSDRSPEPRRPRRQRHHRPCAHRRTHRRHRPRFRSQPHRRRCPPPGRGRHPLRPTDPRRRPRLTPADLRPLPERWDGDIGGPDRCRPPGLGVGCRRSRREARPRPRASRQSSAKWYGTRPTAALLRRRSTSARIVPRWFCSSRCRHLRGSTSGMRTITWRSRTSAEPR